MGKGGAGLRLLAFCTDLGLQTVPAGIKLLYPLRINQQMGRIGYFEEH